jgi:hypothetical protein
VVLLAEANKDMAYLHKKLERRTYSQDRYYILIKRQKAGKATFKELTELDEIVNRVPDIREQVILENFMEEDNDTPQNDQGQEFNLQQHSIQHPNFWSKIKALITRAFNSHITSREEEKLSPLF